MQRTPENVKSVIVADKQSKSFCIALSVLKITFDKDVITKALIDSRASINCLNWGFIKKHKIPYHRLPQPICAKNVDGDEPPHQIRSYSLLFSLFLRFLYITDPPLHTSAPMRLHSLYRTNLAYLMDI